MSTLNIAPMFAPRMIRDAMDRAGVKGVTITDEGGLVADDLDTALSTLAGAVMTLYITETMVMDSNGAAVANAAADLHSFATVGSVIELKEGIADVADTLDGIARNLRSDK